MSTHKAMTDKETRDSACLLTEKLNESVSIQADNVTEALVWHAMWFTFVETMREENPEAYARYEALLKLQVEELLEAVAQVASEDKKAAN